MSFFFFAFLSFPELDLGSGKRDRRDHPVNRFDGWSCGLVFFLAFVFSFSFVLCVAK